MPKACTYGSGVYSSMQLPVASMLQLRARSKHLRCTVQLPVSVHHNSPAWLYMKLAWQAAYKIMTESEVSWLSLQKSDSSEI